MAKILLVEDDDTITFGIRAALAKKGYEVSGCAGIAEAKHVFSREFALVLLDLNLPDGSGYEPVQMDQRAMRYAHYFPHSARCSGGYHKRAGYGGGRLCDEAVPHCGPGIQDRGGTTQGA